MTAPNKLMITIFKLAQRAKAPDNGGFEVVPWVFILTNTGLSASCIRIHSETMRRMAEIRNGMRQPHDLKAPPPRRVGVAITPINAPNSPKVAVVWMKLVNRPRFPCGEF